MEKATDISRRESLILAALLHDIGKFYQRAYPQEEVLSQITINLQQHICPYREIGSFFTHKHVLWTNEFFEKFFSRLSLSANFAIYHHKPAEYEHKIIQIADWLSSGERIKRTEDEMDGVTPETSKIEPLVSIFSQISLKEQTVKGHFCKAVPVSSDFESLIPVKTKQEAVNDKTNFKTLWDGFEKEITRIGLNVPFQKFFMKIFSLLEKYAIFVPSSAYKDSPTVSLFHHLKSTAAIASCIYDIQPEKEEFDEIESSLKNINGTRKDFAIISGDISGIQDFIYSVTTSHALKGLRGRSFYLQMMSEVVANYILDQFNLFKCNLLYCGGGNFSILVPKISDFENKISEIEEKLSKRLFEYHPNLAIVLGWTDLTYSEFLSENFPKTIARLKMKMDIKKRRKYASSLDYRKIFKPFPEKIDKELSGCEICGIETEIKKCEMCSSFEELAKNVRKAQVITLWSHTSDSSQSAQKQGWKKVICSLGYDYGFGSLSSNNGVSFLINDTEFLYKNCDGWRFEPFYSPEGTLEDIAKCAQGAGKWAALRMDVDDLGKIFSQGLGKNLSLSRFSMLSYMMNLFFTAGIDHIRKQKYNGSCVVYAGGDDLFIIGPWSEIPYFAIDIQRQFTQYTCNNPSITISAGIFVAPSDGFPVFRAAKESGEALENSKKQSKNRISFLETVATWKEFEEIEKVTEELVYLMKKENVSRSILNIFYSGFIEKELLEKGKIPYIRIWRIFYAVKRFMERHRSNDVRIKLEKLRKQFITSDSGIQEKLDMAVRWAELLTRKEEQRGEK
ncbi:MAG: type III-A CRISPR-associated protein Cas10/Csm1 [Candidatus Omnitrophica bacterium]|nr:type III-A CRISPR-associated protein Cas10/Csm1 [Candidatus Omnitrophota bacterium]